VPQVDSVQELGQIFLPLGINSSATPYYFILDTGAGMSAIDQKLADDLVLPVIGQTELAGTAGVLEVPLKQIDSLTPLRRLIPIPELTQHNLVVTTQDLSQFKVPMPSTAEAGLLGNDYLRQFVVEIEFMPPALHISKPQGYTPAGVDPDQFLPMWLDTNNIMRVNGRLDDWLEVELRVDSGAATLGLGEPYLNITTAIWKQLQTKNSQYKFHHQLTAGGMGGMVELNIGRIGSLEVGPLRFENPGVVVQPEQGIFASPDAVGFISLNLFEPGKWLTLDYAAGKIYLPSI